MSVQRYVVFAGYDYEAKGGWDDYYSEHDSPRAAACAAEDAIYKEEYEWAHVVDMQEGEMLSRHCFGSAKDERPEVLDELTDEGLKGNDTSYAA